MCVCVFRGVVCAPLPRHPTPTARTCVRVALPGRLGPCASRANGSLFPRVLACVPVCLPDVRASLHVSPRVWVCVPLLGLCGCGNSSFLLRQPVGDRRQHAVPRPETDARPASARSPRPSCRGPGRTRSPRGPQTLTLARPTLAHPSPAPDPPRGASALHSLRGHTEDARGAPDWPVRVQRGEKVGGRRPGDRSAARVQLRLLTSSAKGTTWRRAGAGPEEAEPGRWGPGRRGLEAAVRPALTFSPRLLVFALNHGFSWGRRLLVSSAASWRERARNNSSLYKFT